MVFSKHYQINMAGFEKLHPHPQKYGRIYLYLQTEGFLRPEDVFVPEEVTPEQVRLVHTAGFVDSLKDSATVAQYLEAPILAGVPNAAVDAGVISAFRRATGGTILAGRLALRYGIGINLAGGYHHAKPEAGEGFCLFNDMSIAIRTLQKEGLIRKAAIVDLDVHQGNGNAVCLAGDANVFILDLYENDIYPKPKEPVSLAVPLSAGIDDEIYLKLLKRSLPAVLTFQPDIVFLQSGADVLDGDPLARLKLTPGGLVQRDALVIDTCRKAGIPVVVVLGGGYRDDAWQAQATSIIRTLKTYGLTSGGEPYPRRAPTSKERLYTK